MAEQITLGDPPITVTVRRSPRARRYSLRISASDGTVSLTLPKRAPLGDAVAFARTKEDWLRAHLTDRPATVPAAFGATWPVEGQMLTLAQGEGRSVRIVADRLELPGPDGRLPGQMRGFLRDLARDRLLAASDRYAARLGRPFSRITLRDTRSRWGSCTSDGRLMYSWRLILAPTQVLDYVAAHEVCHLAEMNHSAAFWALVGELCPGYDTPRAWLREHGPALHRYRL